MLYHLQNFQVCARCDAGTFVSGLFSDRLTYYLGEPRYTPINVGTTALGLLGFPLSDPIWMLYPCCLAGVADVMIRMRRRLNKKSKHA